MVLTWKGRRRVAFIPVWNRQVDSEPPPDWPDRVGARAFFELDPADGIDGSLQRYIQAVSSGRAWIEGAVFPTVAADDADTVTAGLQSLPPSHGYKYAVIVLPHDVGPHRGGFAWWDATPVNGVPNFARVAMFRDVVLAQRQNIGVWAMELLHIVTRFGDLYNVSPQLDRFDVMACSCGTHPSAHTKSAMGWIHDGSVVAHGPGTTAEYELHAVSLSQPPPPWRATAVRLPSQQSLGHLMIECRLRTDPHENTTRISSGIPREGVILYEVRGTAEVYLRTPSALGPGDHFDDAGENLSLSVLAAPPGGFRVRVRSRPVDRCPQLAAEIQALQLQLQFETDINVRKQLISALAKAQEQFRALRCLPVVDAPTELFLPLEASSGECSEGKG